MSFAQAPVTGHKKCKDKYQWHYQTEFEGDRMQPIPSNYSSVDRGATDNDFIDNEKSNISPKYHESLLLKLQDILQAEEKWYRKTKQKLDKQKLELIQAVNEVYGDFSSEVEKTYKKNLDLLKAKQDKIRYIVTEDCRQINTKLQRHLDELNETQNDLTLYHFEEKNIDLSEVKILFGKLVSESQCAASSGLVVDILPVNTRSAWIHRFGTSRIELFTDTKTVTDVIDIDIENCDGFIIAKDGNFVYSDYDNKCLKSLTRRQEGGSLINVLHSFTDLHPYGLCNANDGGILVCVNEHDVCDVVNKHTLKTKRFVQHFSLNGELLKTIGWRKSHSNYVLNFPTRVKQKRNTDIIVIDRISENEGHLYVMDVMGGVRCCFRDERDVFDPGDVYLDTHDNILVSSGVNHSIYVLDSNGIFLKRINIKRYIPNPHSLALINNTLWVGNTEGDVRVFSYQDMKLKIVKKSN